MDLHACAGHDRGSCHAGHGPSHAATRRFRRQAVHEREGKQRGKPRRQGPPRHPARHIYRRKRGRQHDRRLRSDHEHGIGIRHHRGSQSGRSHRYEPYRQRQKRSDGVGGEEPDRLAQRSMERKATQLLQQPRQTNQLRQAEWNGGFHTQPRQSHHVDRQRTRTGNLRHRGPYTGDNHTKQRHRHQNNRVHHDDERHRGQRRQPTTYGRRHDPDPRASDLQGIQRGIARQKKSTSAVPGKTAHPKR